MDKYYQDENHNSHIIILDFRLAHFDSLSVKGEIKTILANKGMEFPSLSGILAATPKRPDSDILENDPDYVFINNPYCMLQLGLRSWQPICNLLINRISVILATTIFTFLFSIPLLYTFILYKLFYYTM